MRPKRVVTLIAGTSLRVFATPSEAILLPFLFCGCATVTVEAPFFILTDGGATCVANQDLNQKPDHLLSLRQTLFRLIEKFTTPPFHLATVFERGFGLYTLMHRKDHLFNITKVGTKTLHTPTQDALFQRQSSFARDHFRCPFRRWSRRYCLLCCCFRFIQGRRSSYNSPPRALPHSSTAIPHRTEFSALVPRALYSTAAAPTRRSHLDTGFGSASQSHFPLTRRRR
jgi:hypothetical protein